MKSEILLTLGSYKCVYVDKGTSIKWKCPCKPCPSDWLVYMYIKPVTIMNRLSHEIENTLGNLVKENSEENQSESSQILMQTRQCMYEMNRQSDLYRTLIRLPIVPFLNASV